MSSSDLKSSKVLFCPFCREAFEGAATCPDHELVLVPFEALPSKPKPPPGLNDSLSIIDLRFGRGLLALGAVVNAIGFMGQFATLVRHDSVTWSTMALAATSLPSLWTVPIISGLCVWLLIARRTIARLHAVRIVVPALAVFIPITLASAYMNLLRWAGKQANSLYEVHVTLGWGPMVSAFGALIMIVAGLRLGVVKEVD